MPQRSDAQDGRPRRGEFYAWRYMYTSFIKRYTCRPCVMMIMMLMRMKVMRARGPREATRCVYYGLRENSSRRDFSCLV